MLKNWVALPTCPPLVPRRCHACASEHVRPYGGLRVRAHHKLIGAWLLALGTACGETAKVTVPERVDVRSAPPELLDRLHDNGPGLTAGPLRDPVVRRRRRIAGPDRGERPSWQSPYGPQPPRPHRGRWTPAPVLVRSRHRDPAFTLKT